MHFLLSFGHAQIPPHQTPQEKFETKKLEKKLYDTTLSPKYIQERVKDYHFKSRLKSNEKDKLFFAKPSTTDPYIIYGHATRMIPF